MRTYEEPSFLEPLNSTFVYAGWSADPVRVGPFMRRSNDRRRKIDEVRGFAAALADQPEIEGVRLFEATFMPPLRGMPKHDVVLLARILRGCSPPPTPHGSGPPKTDWPEPTFC
jgi:hypothetical protein